MRVGGLTIRVKSPPGLNFFHRERFTPFWCASRHHDILWNFQLVDANNPPSMDATDDANDDPAIRLPPAGPPIRDTKPVRKRMERSGGPSEWVLCEEHADSFVMLDFKTHRMDMFFTPSAARKASDRIATSALLAPFLPGFDACMLHASAVVRGGRSALFLAPDEGGKTTAARLSPSGIILGDDQVIVRRYGNKFRVSGTPWGLHINARDAYPLGGLFLLKKAAQFNLERLSIHELIPEIWKEINAPLSILPKTLRKKAFSLVCDMADAAPVWRMSFPINAIDWAAVEKAME